MNNSTNLYREKDAGIVTFNIEDVDTVEGKIKAYASGFDNIDSDQDVVRKGAFIKSINERGPQSKGNRKIAHLLQHNIQQPIGVITELHEDSKGLVFVSQLSKATDGQDALIKYQEGIYREHSIGFNIVRDKYRKVGEVEAKAMGYDQPFWEIKEAILMELSTVTFGANENTPVIDVKNQSSISYLCNLNNEATNISKSLRSWKGSEKGAQDMELMLLQVFSKYNKIIDSLTAKQPSTDTVETIEPNNNDAKRAFMLNLLQQ
jgi:HK97 family phage prohead protease